MYQANTYATLDTLNILDIHQEPPKKSQESQEYQEYQGFSCNSQFGECLQPAYCTKLGRCRWGSHALLLPTVEVSP